MNEALPFGGAFLFSLLKFCPLLTVLIVCRTFALITAKVFYNHATSIIFTIKLFKIKQQFGRSLSFGIDENHLAVMSVRLSAF